MISKRYWIALLVATGLILSALPARVVAQDQTIITIERRNLQMREHPTIYEILAIPYEEGDAMGVELRGTAKLPEGNGEAKVERHKGATEIEIELDEMKPAYLFGGDFNTYVLWAASPEGKVENLGELVLNGNRSKLDATTRMEKFALFVTAEPHFMVDNPSSFLVLQNVRAKESIEGEPDTARIKAVPEWAYEFDRKSLVDAKEVKGEVHTILNQADTAVKLAREAGAAVLAPSEFTEAEAALNQAHGAAKAKGRKADEVDRLAREAVSKADKAEDTALARAA